MTRDKWLRAIGAVLGIAGVRCAAHPTGEPVVGGREVASITPSARIPDAAASAAASPTPTASAPASASATPSEPPPPTCAADPTARSHPYSTKSASDVCHAGCDPLCNPDVRTPPHHAVDVALGPFLGIGSFGARDVVVSSIAEAIGWAYGGMEHVPARTRGVLSLVVAASGKILTATIEAAALTPLQRRDLAARIHDDLHDARFAMCASAGDITIAVPFSVAR